MRHVKIGTFFLLPLLFTAIPARAQTAPTAPPGPDARDWRYTTSIFDIARADDSQRLQQLLADNPDRVFLRLPSDGSTAAHVAAEAGALKSLEALQSAGADLNTTDSKKRTPLSIATGTKFLATTKQLIKLGADPNKEGADCADTNGQFTLSAAPELPLCIAARHGYLDIAKVLMDGKADVNSRGSNGNTPLLSAVAAGHWNIATLLIDQNANVNTADNDGMTPLLYAAAASDEKNVAFLLAKGADPRAADRSGRTGLSLTQSAPIWKMLVEKGADVNVVVRGVTPLQYFIAQGKRDLVNVWLNYNPDPFLTDRQGHTAKELARRAAELDSSDNRRDIARLVEEYQKRYAAEQLEKEQPRAAQ